MLKKILFLLQLLITGSMYAHELSGIVSDEQGNPLEGIGVYNKTTRGYTYTNIFGYYELNDIATGHSIFFYGLGYSSKEMEVTNALLDATLNVVLEESAFSLDQVVLVADTKVLSTIVNIDVMVNPIKSSQEILRKVPGLLIGQHAGGGKAEQIFLRGFDIDHGTDITLSVDGLPINMVSHAHGQGYADMHFIIPETIETIDFGKGPYYADKGNFNTAGYVELKTKRVLDEDLFSIEAGQFNSLRALGMFKVLESPVSNAYIASELILGDGPFEAPQNFNRLNVLGRYNYDNKTDEEFSLTLSHFQSKWDASGQIPQRAVDQGIIGRFGAIDNTEGGNTSRSNIWVDHTKQLDEHSKFKSMAYVSAYDFELFSNFTFFLEDAVNGDQIQQKENRTVIGAQSRYEYSFDLGDHNAQLKYSAGTGFRYDDVNDVQLSKTLNRKTVLERLTFGNVDELNLFGFFEADYRKNKWTINPGIRIDYLKFDYINLLTETFDNKSENKLFFGPKLNAIYSPSTNLQFFVKTGIGFHSNDTRVVTANNGEKILPAAFGSDVGATIKPTEKLLINAALWSLFLQQEFVYVGDAGIVEPSGKTQRFGVDVGLRYEITDWLYLNGDLNYTYARSVDEMDGEDYIPLSPDLTSSGGLSFRNLGKFSGNLNYRYIKDRPANENNSIVAKGYFINDFNVNYTADSWTFGLVIENLFDSEWNEAQFATESRLFNEVSPVEEIHFTPGTPFYIRGKVAVRF